MTDSAKKLSELFGGIWGEHPDFPVSDWQYEVANGDERQSYWDWALSKGECN